jgi:hypothetical protein
MSGAVRRVITWFSSCIDEMNMLQSVKRFWWVFLLVAGVPAARGFSLLDPITGGDAWQTTALGYGTLANDVGGPGNLAEEYRPNTPVLFYAYDANYLEFFGSNGVAAVDGAFAMMNNVFSNSLTGPSGVDGYTNDLSSVFPFYAKSVNYTAQALGLTDMRSVVLGVLMPQLGLADPVRYVWTLRSRTGTPYPSGITYLVIQRNFDTQPSPLNSPVGQTQYSSYINNVLYSYNIFDNGSTLAETVPIPADPYASTYAPVASFQTTFLDYGYFYTGLTSDDVAGLRYLLTTNNINTEDPSTGALLVTTNLGAFTFITTSNLNTLVVAAQTNAPGLIPGLFPGVTVTSSTTNITVLVTPNLVSTYTTPNGAPYPYLPVLVTVTNGYTYTPALVYQDTFGGILTSANLTNTPYVVLNGLNVPLSYYTNTPASQETVTLGTLIGSPYPAPIVTNTTTVSITLTNSPSGEYFTIPAGQCGWQFMSPQLPGFPLTNVVVSTNIITQATNTSTTLTNGAGFVASVSVVTYFTNHTYVVYPINCVDSTPAAGLYEGIEHIQYVKSSYDSLIGQFFQPFTNNYTMTLVTNSRTVVQNFQRVITAPDILLTAADTATAAGYAIESTAPVWDEANVGAGLAGPGTINPPTTFTFDKVGPLYTNGWSALNSNPLITTIGETNQMQLFLWASFDYSTNDPVAYPSGISIQNLMNQVLIQISPATVPDGTHNAAYAPVTFTVSGGGAFEPPFTWSATGLPSGLTVTTDANGNGYLSGRPAQAGTFDFTLQLTDSLGRSVSWDYSITIH